ncbi:sugar ABC transporter permease [Serinibacter arcticus]|uniref:Sugar ABC transporter permease n=1 Tax=Serinibacter arcticus TaxID=1655435 RepID=A0A2U1ZSL1_9MICO|nr:sugar ABC transporter permease [Serinibacter arcticus]PWD49912.1 sugar ABC transporter permease [Serinibacter arcticus]
MSLATPARPARDDSRAGGARTDRRPPPHVRRDARTGYLFIAPQLLGIVAFVLVPLGLIVYYSLHEWNVLANTFTFVGLDNVERLFNDPQLASVLRATVVFSLGLVVVNLSLALLLAVMLNRRWPGVTVFRTIFFSPVVISLVAWTIVWGFLLQSDGGINGALAMLGIDGPNWLREGWGAMIAVIVVQVFKNVGLNMVLFLSALQGVPRELHEAARIDGASDAAIFRRITLPLISPMIMLTSIITIVGSLQVYAQVAVLTQGGPGISTTVLVYYLVQQSFDFHQFGYGSTLAIVLFVIVLVLTIAQWQLRKRWVHYES